MSVRAARRRPVAGGEPVSVTLLIWVAVAFLAAACWAVVVIVTKRALDYVSPLAANLTVRAITLVVMALTVVPLSALHLWSLGFTMTWKAAGYIAVSAFVTWLLAFNFYYYALRAGRVGVVTPLTSIDPLFTAVFAAILLGAGLSALGIAGLLVACVGVILVSYWMGGSAEPHPEVLDVVAAGEGHLAPAVVIVLALATSAGWGLSPVLIELAENSVGGPSSTMLLESQSLGLLMLAALVLWRRPPFFTRPCRGGVRRRVMLLLLTAAVLEVVFSVLFYLLIQAIGAMLTVLVIATSPIFSILGGVVLLKERLGAKLALAAAITLAGVFLVTVARL